MRTCNIQLHKHQNTLITKQGLAEVSLACRSFLKSSMPLSATLFVSAEIFDLTFLRAIHCDIARKTFPEPRPPGFTTAQRAHLLARDSDEVEISSDLHVALCHSILIGRDSIFIDKRTAAPDVMNHSYCFQMSIQCSHPTRTHVVIICRYYTSETDSCHGHAPPAHLLHLDLPAVSQYTLLLAHGPGWLREKVESRHSWLSCLHLLQTLQAPPHKSFDCSVKPREEEKALYCPLHSNHTPFAAAREECEHCWGLC